ncbi:eukaryotic translation initiation factor 3 subunit A-like [Macadamia integrifolia]|uniref:eukaryotic translation initiation factor 3 subunit A-like n=1 Tax=Macadamia integrifolia TaxID=60698 RepID=UPI001C4FE51C|nr:eukaryotic translation initiation factor 3 subunit A-like [Macadamia integrifolia]
MSTFAKPENALKRAEELINVGQKQAALQALHDLITSKRYRAWQKTLERIMFKYVELCVDMRRGRFAKDGLIQYRIVCQQVNVNSLEEVIKHFMHLSTEKAEQARSQAQALEEALDVDDLEADKRPEDLMLSYVSGEKGKDRSDRELVTPWFKFLWETYRTVLEILRNNSKLESLYAMTAHRAFQFCKQYKRTTEFRRLCEIIRNHLANLNKYRDQRDRPDLSSPESLQLYLDTRFEQLKIATELELWQEAFRSVEDIHGLMCMVKKTPKPSLMVIYYAKLTEIFWVSESHLYHAYAWLKLFTLQKSYNKNLTQKDLQLIASSVVLAALSVTPYDHTHGASHLELENEKERNLRMASLIGFNLDPKRESREMLARTSLLSDLVSKGVMTCVSQEVKDLYHLLEHDFFPLDLASKVQPLLTKISKLGGKLASASAVPEVQLSQYVPALEKLATLRLLQQVLVIFSSLFHTLLGSKRSEFRLLEPGSASFGQPCFSHFAVVFCYVYLNILTGMLHATLQQEIELSRQRHAGDLQEKNRLARMLDQKTIFQEKIVSRREVEINKLKRGREERIKQLLQARKQERETRRKLIFYLRSEEERLNKLHEEEEARKREAEERRKKEEAERKAKLDEIAEKQRQRERELEEKERLRREALLARSVEPPLRSAEPPVVVHQTEPVAAAAAAAPNPGKYVPRFKRDKVDASGVAPSSEPDRWGRHDDRPPQSSDRWRSDDRRSFSGSGGARSSTWSSSRTSSRGGPER